MQQKIKVVTDIKCPEEWESNDDWDSHRASLYLSCKNTSGRIMEMGSGEGSTPLLRKYCLENNREFHSYETNVEWATKTGSELLSDYDGEHGANLLTMFKQQVDIGFIFVDAAPAEVRKRIIEKYRGATDVIVVHDSEESSNFCYGMKEILSTFRYRLDYRPVGKPHTSVLSDVIDVTDWE